MEIYSTNRPTQPGEEAKKTLEMHLEEAGIPMPSSDDSPIEDSAPTPTQES